MLTDNGVLLEYSIGRMATYYNVCSVQTNEMSVNTVACMSRSRQLQLNSKPEDFDAVFDVRIRKKISKNDLPRKPDFVFSLQELLRVIVIVNLYEEVCLPCLDLNHS